MPRSKDRQPAGLDVPAGADSVVQFAVANPETFGQIVEVFERSVRDKARARKTVEYSDDLRARLVLLDSKPDFERGDLVVWKEGMKNRTRPDYDEPAIVVDLLTEPVFGASDEPGSAYFREPLDLRAGVLDNDEEFVIYHFDARRFQKAPDRTEEDELVEAEPEEGR